MQVQWVEDQVAQHQGKGGFRAAGGDWGDEVMRQHLHFPQVARLRVAKDEDLEAVWLALAAQREVNGGRQRPGRSHAGVTQARRAVWLVQVVELGRPFRSTGQASPVA